MPGAACTFLLYSHNANVYCHLHEESARTSEQHSVLLDNIQGNVRELFREIDIENFWMHNVGVGDEEMLASIGSIWDLRACPGICKWSQTSREGGMEGIQPVLF